MPIRLATAGIEALVTMLAALACLLCAWRIDPQPSTAVLAIVLSVSLGRSQIDRDLHGRIEAAFVLPAVALACAGVGWLLHTAPAAGAVVYVFGVAFSIWIRRYGVRAQRAGSLIALPFVTLLTVPVRPPSGGSTVSLLHVTLPIPAFMLPILTGWLALFWVGLAHWILKRVTRRSGRASERLPHTSSTATTPRVIAVAAKAAPAAAPMPTTAPETSGASPSEAALVRPATVPLPSTRMALQMAVALAGSFIVGYLLFHEHWAWIVLTAMIVNLGNRGRLDVVYKGLQRLAGAAAGTVVAFATGYALALLAPPTAHASANGLAALFALFMGMWLRPFGYAWWALFITIALALMQGLAPLASLQLLEMRLLAIAVGAVIGVAGAWWVYPIDSADVLRRRLADALARLGEAFDPDPAGRTERQDADPSTAFREALGAVGQVAPVFRAAQRFKRWTMRHPVRGAANARRSLRDYLHALSLDADRIDALTRCETTAYALIALGGAPAAVRRAVGAARKTLRDREANLQALRDLAGQLERAANERAPA